MELTHSIGRIRKAAGMALDRVTRVSGKPDDEDLRIYDNMKPEAFDALVAKYGPERVIEYIRHMEARKLRQHG